jgi:serine/threonine protein kinase
MSARPVVSEKPRCRNCQKTVDPEESYCGYCFGCLLLPALSFHQVSEIEQSGRFGPYEILTHPDGSYIELGRGSMGITYEALDTNLFSSVALKVINSEAAGEIRKRSRFLREARAAAKLRHPHVASVLYYGVRDDGQCFYAMELVEGETLAQRVRHQGPLPIQDALTVMSQMASALEATERCGLVHRDLKPANLMLVNGPGINVKVIDFGLAKVVGNEEPFDQITQDGFIGTPAFASPEQLSGRQLDRRSDYYSLGSTLFYLLTGSPLFAAADISELANCNRRDGWLANHLKAARLPGPAQRLLSSLLSADPEDRPQNAQELKEAIVKCQRATDSRRHKLLLTVSLFTALVALVGFLSFSGAIPGGNAVEKSIAVLPFENLSSTNDKAYFADGVQDEILTRLAGIADLQVISSSSVKGYRDPVSRPPLPEIAKALHVNYLVCGSVQRDADRIRVTARIVEAKTGRQLWAEHYDGDVSEVFAIQTQIAEVISQELRVKLSSTEKASMEVVPTREIAAYESYLHATELLGNYDEATQGFDPLYSAVRLLDEAVNRDPDFALAWVKLAYAYDSLYWYNSDRSDSCRLAAENALRKASALQPDLGELHLQLARHLLAIGRNYPAMAHELEIARRSLPNSAQVSSLLANVEMHRGQWHDALRDFDRASSLDPRSLSLMLVRCNIYQFHRQYDEVGALFAKAAVTWASAETIELQKALTAWQGTGDTAALHALLDEPSGPLRAIPRATILKLICAMGDRDFGEAEKILASDPKAEFEGGDRRVVCRDYLLGWIKWSEGDATAARAALATARPLQLAYVQKWPDDPNPLMMLALTDAALGQKEDALREGRQAVAMRPISQDAVEGPLLAADLAQVFLLTGDRELAFKQLEMLEQVPRALKYGELAKSPDWDSLRDDPRFEKILSEVKQPIPIVNRERSEGPALSKH